MVKRHPLISAVIVGVDRRAFRRLIANEALERLGVRVAHNGGGHAVRLSVLRPDDDGLAYRSPACLQLLVAVLVLFLAADESFVDFNRADKQTHLGLKRLAQPVQHEPCGLLADA